MAKVLRQLDDEAIERPFNKRQLIRLLAYMKPYKRTVMLSLALMVIAAVSSLGSPFLMSRAIDSLSQGNKLVWLVLGMVALAIFDALCTRGRIRLMETTGRKALATLREDLFHHIQTMSFSFFDTRSAGKILVRVIKRCQCPQRPVYQRHCQCAD
ncbi:MAG: ABC transporter transmembrane domain-containing protein [Christensenellales bacterium]